MSARDRVVAFFTAPGQFFADICDSPYIEINWRIPITVFVLVTLVLRQLMLTNPGLLAQMESKIGQELTTAVTTGQMSQEEVNQARTFAKNKKTKDILGSGLGLSIVKKIVDLYGGTIAVASVPDQGTEISVFLKSFPLA
jgi:signal transduction histidine kinase